eukprot:scaffold310381_cov26-Tisochrysis_lutea.AAC.3
MEELSGCTEFISAVRTKKSPTVTSTLPVGTGFPRADSTSQKSAKKARAHNSKMPVTRARRTICTRPMRRERRVLALEAMAIARGRMA